MPQATLTKLNKLHKIEPVFVDWAPPYFLMEHGKAYIYLDWPGLYMLCPCGCRAETTIPFSKDTSIHWTFTQHSDGTISLDPSLLNTFDCRSHFFIKHNQVLWC